MAQSSGTYYVPHGSKWPIIGSVALFLLLGGAASLMNGDQALGMPKFVVGLALLLVMLFGWFGNVIKEGRLAGLIDWLHIVDRTRGLRGNGHWDYQ